MRCRKLIFERLEDRRVLAADFNSDQTVDAADLEIWETGFGTVNTATQSTGDSDGDMDADGADFLAWQREFGTVPLVAPRGGEARPLSTTSIQVTWEPSVGATSYIVIRRLPATETEYTIIAPNFTGTSFIDTGLTPNTLYEYRVAAQRNPQSPFGPPIQAPTESNLTAYRPQFVQLFEVPTGGPIYDPLPKTAVLDEHETSTTLGPGIRINADDDNRNGFPDRADTSAIPQENDLIEVKIDRVPGVLNLVLSLGPRLQAFYHHDRTEPLLADEPIGFVDNTSTIFVEWVSNTHGTDLLTLVDQATQTPLDSIRFHSFRSIVIVLGGNTQSPFDADGDGRMGDLVTGMFSAPGNREGIFDLATNLYLTGWDVLPFGEEEIIEGGVESSVPYEEVTNALDRRFVNTDVGGGFSIMGYSQGGGATHDLIEAVYNRRTNPVPNDVTTFGVYLDAVDHGLPDPSPAPETRWPFAVAYLLNLYQTNNVPRGGALDEPILGDLEEYDVNNTPGLEDVGHQQIDDNLTIQALIRTRLGEILNNR